MNKIEIYEKVTRNENKTKHNKKNKTKQKPVGINYKPFWVFSKNMIAQGPFNMFDWVVDNLWFNI